MKDLGKDKIELRSRLKRTIAIGIVVLIVVFLPWLSDGLEPPVILIVITWIIMYIDYCVLKLKIEIVEELSEENETNKSK